jgi:glycosyltransferase involved in cell wall biosynthesis
VYLSQGLFNPDAGNETNLQRADIFHSPYFPIPERVRKHKNIKPFLTVHDLIPIRYPEFFSLPSDGGEHPLKVIVDGIRREDWVVCVSQSTKDDLCNYRKDLDPGRIFVTHLGASEWFYPCQDNLAIEKVRAKYKLPAGRYVLSVCTLEPRKNLAHLIRCFAQLIQQERLSDLHLVLVGNLGWKYESIFAELTSTKALRDRIIIAGYVKDEDMAALYSGSLFFVYPSLYEGFGLPPLEAMQCGVPVITSNTSSLPEVVGDAGIMVNPQDSDALCQAMMQLVSDGNWRKTAAQKCLQQARKFGWAQCADQTLNAYHAAITSVR